MLDTLVLQVTSDDWRAQAEVFDQLFFVFLALGTLVGIIVVGYTLLNAYKSRATGETPDDFDAPTLGELPVGQQSKKSKNLFLSFGLSAVLVISLVTYSYALLLFVEEGPTNEVENGDLDELEVQVIGHQFYWEFIYPNGKSVQAFSADEGSTPFRVPAGDMVRLSVTGGDVWHNFGVPELRVKSDAIPGENSSTWFVAEEPGAQHTIRCYELCGSGHSNMNANLLVMENDEFYNWLEEDESDEEAAGNVGTAPEVTG
jgi:cytochrome c oxidase subunit 2